MDYAYVKLINDRYDLHAKCSEAMETRQKARLEAQKRVLSEIGCDALLYGRGTSLYLGYKKMPVSDNPWWLKSDIGHADGFKLLTPKKKTPQAEKFDAIKRDYEKALDSEVDNNTTITKAYPEILKNVTGTIPSGQMVVASPAFAVLSGEHDIIVGKLPIPPDNKVVIPEDFQEIVTTEFKSYFTD